MSTEENKSEIASAPPESQSDRWIKYGANVALTIILVIALGVGVTWFAQHVAGRVDMTQGGSLSLKPQTRAVLKDLKQHITLVSLYNRPKDDDKPDDVAQAQRVSDLLDEYKDKSAKIDVKVIDPAREKDKLEALHQDFIKRYGKSIKNYKEYLDQWTAEVEQIKKLIAAQAAAAAPFAKKPGVQADEDSPIDSYVNTVTDALPDMLDQNKQKITTELENKHPDYKAATERAKDAMQQMSDVAGQIVDRFAPRVQTVKDVPAEFKKLVSDSIPQFQQIKKIADESVAKQAKLGELKVDELEHALDVKDPILVLGDDEWRILSRTQVWQDDTNARNVAAGKMRPRFAGEQQVTTAIFSLENPIKKKVCFVRPGGPPVTQHGFPPFVPNGEMSIAADRLRDYNFDVTEKDLSGEWAIQAQMRQMPTPPEPKDDDIKDALWIVLDTQSSGGEQGQMPTPKLAGKLKEHLDHGGSALILCQIHGEDLNGPLKDWGIEAKPESVSIHETVNVNEAEAGVLEQAKSQPYIWAIRDFGDHPLARPIKNLDALFFAPIALKTIDAKNCTVTPLAPLTMNGLKTWATSDLESLQQNAPKTEPGKSDILPPLYGGAASEKSGGGRVVVLASLPSFGDGLIRFYDPKLRAKKIYVNVDPGNGELFQNSVFWLTHLEPMIAISPAAMDVARIDNMSDGMLNFWRFGVVVLPLCVVLAGGALVYVKRRD